MPKVLVRGCRLTLLAETMIMALRKHGVGFDEASTVFRDQLAFIFDDDAHSAQEHREIIIGHSGRDRLLWSPLQRRPGTWFALSVLVWQPKEKEKTMKKTEASKSGSKESDDMLSEYEFDYSKARPNRFASRIQKEEVTVTLDPDVSEVFTTSESVNTVLRALIETMPGTKGRKRVHKRLSDQKNG